MKSFKQALSQHPENLAVKRFKFDSKCSTVSSLPDNKNKANDNTNKYETR